MPQKNSVLEQLDINRQAHRDDKPKDKKKEKLSSLCKTPPSLIKNKHGKDFRRGSCLGEGGFARCFQVKDDSGKLFAAKTVAKASITQEKTRSKLLTEISIHRSVRHPNIIRFVDCFEDDTNVYILLEYCSNQSLMELIRKRKRLTEPEVRYFTVQIIGAVSYLHSKRVLHRDLKLGNIMLDESMDIKIGDFGLATVLWSDRDRRKTICGTPNYIAPEVLYDKVNGHSYEADIWSIGIIIYAMLFGKPPFQSKNVDAIYKRIKHNDFKFPEDIDVSDQAKDLICCLLTPEPHKRLTLDGILTHPFFKSTFPRVVTTGSLTKEPSYRNVTKEKSQQNFIECQIGCQLLARATNGVSLQAGRAKAAKALNPLEVTKVAVEAAEKSHHILPTSISPASTKEKYKMVMVRENDATAGGPLLFSKIMNSQQSTSALAASAASKKARIGSAGKSVEQRRPELFIARWVDFSNRKGFGYQLSNGKYGALLRNGMVLVKDPATNVASLFQNNGTLEPNWKKTVLLSNGNARDEKLVGYINFFQEYMSERLAEAVDGMDKLNHPREELFLVDYERTEDFVMFEFNNGGCQYNFPDHGKVVLSCRPGTNEIDYVHYLDPAKKLHGWPLDEAFRVAQLAETSLTSLSKYDLHAKLVMCMEDVDAHRGSE